MAQLTFLAALRAQFVRPGQTMTSFAAELKALTPADKAWYYDALQKAGIECSPPANAAPAAAA